MLVVGLLASPAMPAPCTVRVSAGGDVQQAVTRAVRRRRPAVVCLGRGRFVLRRLVAIDHDGVTLRGEGAETELRLVDGVQSPVIVVGDHARRTPRQPIRHVTIERLRIVGAGAGGGEFDAEHPYLTNSAIVVRDGRDVMIRDVDVSACRSACVLTEHGTRDIGVEQSRIGGAVWDGIALNRTARARIVGNVIRDDTAAGITAEHLVDSLVAGNTIAGNRTHGLYLSDSYRNRIEGNRFVRNVLSGVFLTCAVRDHVPRVACWTGSMSAANVFARNELTGNRVAFTSAPDAAATCNGGRFVANRSRGDVVRESPRYEPGRRAYGRCLGFTAPGSPAGTSRP